MKSKHDDVSLLAQCMLQTLHGIENYLRTLLFRSVPIPMPSSTLVRPPRLPTQIIFEHVHLSSSRPFLSRPSHPRARFVRDC